MPRCLLSVPGRAYTLPRRRCAAPDSPRLVSLRPRGSHDGRELSQLRLDTPSNGPDAPRDGRKVLADGLARCLHAEVRSRNGPRRFLTDRERGRHGLGRNLTDLAPRLNGRGCRRTEKWDRLHELRLVLHDPAGAVTGSRAGEMCWGSVSASRRCLHDRARSHYGRGRSRNGGRHQRTEAWRVLYQDMCPRLRTVAVHFRGQVNRPWARCGRYPHRPPRPYGAPPLAVQVAPRANRAGRPFPPIARSPYPLSSFLTSLGRNAIR